MSRFATSTGSRVCSGCGEPVGDAQQAARVIEGEIRELGHRRRSSSRASSRGWRASDDVYPPSTRARAVSPSCATATDGTTASSEPRATGAHALMSAFPTIRLYTHDSFPIVSRDIPTFNRSSDLVAALAPAIARPHSTRGASSSSRITRRTRRTRHHGTAAARRPDSPGRPPALDRQPSTVSASPTRA